LFGVAYDDEARRIYVCIENHAGDRDVRATLVHEMAHPTGSMEHDDAWRKEMIRLRSAGAPTRPLDFLVPYTTNTLGIVTSFMDAAEAGVFWQEALNDLGDDVLPDVLPECRRYFKIAERKKGR
jgi:hypothetical protein